MGYDSQPFVDMVHTHSKATLVVFSIVCVSLFTLVTYLIFLLIKVSRREMLLCAALIRQKEATHQAERKSMRKSLGFATSSHDIRNSLAALNGLIDACNKAVSPNSETAEYLESMKKTIASLVDLLNSLLDTSKIESEKMKLIEKEFSVAQAIEESVNLYYPNAMDKGIDLVLDPCDGSVLKQGVAKGDCGRLKQVLNNLLHNAIKFTSDGHIVVRAWVKKPSATTSVFASKTSSYWNYISRFSIFKSKEPQDDLSSFDVDKQCQNLVELIIEVDDTGKGIPRDKRKSVFEDFVQARETSLDHDEGTGLGLGIVQSLVRLMGGDICITDKDLREKGTCFRFNIFLSTCENVLVTSIGDVDDYRLLPDKIPLETNIWNLSPNSEVSNIVLFMKQGERRKVIQNFLQGIGCKVSVINNFEHVFPTLAKIKQKGHIRNPSSPGQSDVSSISDLVPTSMPYGTRDLSVTIEDASDSPRRMSSEGLFSFSLIVVDYSAVQFTDNEFLECYSMLESFKKDASESRCKVVWLYAPQTDLEARQSDQRKLAHCEIVMTKPLHGSRLLQLLKLLPEYGGAPTIRGYKPNFTEEFTKSSQSMSQASKSHFEEEIIEASEKVLSGKNVLVVEDDCLLQMLAQMPLEHQGANVTLCGNGEEALKLVSDGLRDNKQRIPYDIIFMDCEMPIMNGIEATRQIRLEEKKYNIRFPIIVLTAHSEDEFNYEEILLAGADSVITKPLDDEKIYMAMELIDTNM